MWMEKVLGEARYFLTVISCSVVDVGRDMFRGGKAKYLLPTVIGKMRSYLCRLWGVGCAGPICWDSGGGGR